MAVTLRAVAVLLVAVMVVRGAASQGLGIVNELNSLPVGSIIGAPLLACIKAQQATSANTMAFIEQIGFNVDSNGNKKARVLEFGYTGLDANGNERDGSISVPVLAVVPIPFLQLESITIEFDLKITQQQDTSSSLTVGASFSVSALMGAFKASVSTSLQTSFEHKVTREYSLHVSVTAGSHETPEGLSMVLDTLLENALRTTSTSGS